MNTIPFLDLHFLHISCFIAMILMSRKHKLVATPICPFWIMLERLSLMFFFSCFTVRTVNDLCDVDTINIKFQLAKKQSRQHFLYFPFYFSKQWKLQGQVFLQFFSLCTKFFFCIFLVPFTFLRKRYLSFLIHIKTSTNCVLDHTGDRDLLLFYTAPVTMGNLWSWRRMTCLDKWRKL